MTPSRWKTGRIASYTSQILNFGGSRSHPFTKWWELWHRQWTYGVLFHIKFDLDWYIPSCLWARNLGVDQFWNIWGSNSHPPSIMVKFGIQQWICVFFSMQTSQWLVHQVVLLWRETAKWPQLTNTHAFTNCGKFCMKSEPMCVTQCKISPGLVYTVWPVGWKTLVKMQIWPNFES